MRFIAILALLAGCEAVNPEASEPEQQWCGEGAPCCEPPSIEEMECPEGSRLVVVGEYASCHNGGNPVGGFTALRLGEFTYGEAWEDGGTWQAVCQGDRIASIVVETEDGACVECYMSGARECGMFPACD